MTERFLELVFVVHFFHFLHPAMTHFPMMLFSIGRKKDISENVNHAVAGFDVRFDDMNCVFALKEHAAFFCEDQGELFFTGSLDLRSTLELHHIRREKFAGDDMIKENAFQQIFAFGLEKCLEDSRLLFL